jgi:hypothetical protein
LKWNWQEKIANSDYIARSGEQIETKIDALMRLLSPYKLKIFHMEEIVGIVSIPFLLNQHQENIWYSQSFRIGIV